MNTLKNMFVIQACSSFRLVATFAGADSELKIQKSK